MADEVDQAAAAASAVTGRARLRENAIGLKDAIIVGMASSGPTASIALTLAAIVGASHYGGPLAILICALPMFGIALAYRRLNQWNVDCGASYTWVGRAVSPYLGFLVGWIMLLGYFLGTISDVLPIGPYVLSIFGSALPHSKLATALSASIWLVIVTVIAYIGIHVTARFQWVLAAIEYVTITVFSVVCLVAVFGHHQHAAHFSWHWFTLQSIGGSSALVSGILIAVYMFSGWDTSVYINEETTHSRVNPGRAVLVSVATLTLMYSFFTFAFQGAVPEKQLLAHGSNSLFYIVQQVAGSPWDKLMVLGVLLSIVGATQAALVSGARIAYAMGADRTLPGRLGKLHPRHRTPATATLLFAGLGLVVLWIYVLGSGSVQGAFSSVVGSVGLMFALFYAATGVGMAIYYRRLAVTGALAFAELLLVPVASAGFLLWVAWKSVPGLGGWGGSVMKIAYAMIGLGIALMIIGRFRRQSDYYTRPTEAYQPLSNETGAR